MEPATLPVWAQTAGIIAIALVSAIIGVFRYLKTEAKDSLSPGKGDTASVISASFVDSKLLRELIEALRELQDEQSRDAKKSHRVSQDLKEALNELNEAVVLQTDTSMSLIRFITREANRRQLEDSMHEVK